MVMNSSPLKSFIEVSPDSHFPIQNLPYGVFKRPSAEHARVGVAIGDQVLDLSVLEWAKLLPDEYFSHPTLNKFMAAGREKWRSTRATITKLLSGEDPRLRDESV